MNMAERRVYSKKELKGYALDHLWDIFDDFGLEVPGDNEIIVNKKYLIKQILRRQSEIESKFDLTAFVYGSELYTYDELKSLPRDELLNIAIDDMELQDIPPPTVKKKRLIPWILEEQWQLYKEYAERAILNLKFNLGKAESGLEAANMVVAAAEENKDIVDKLHAGILRDYVDKLKEQSAQIKSLRSDVLASIADSNLNTIMHETQIKNLKNRLEAAYDKIGYLRDDLDKLKIPLCQHCGNNPCNCLLEIDEDDEEVHTTFSDLLPDDIDRRTKAHTLVDVFDFELEAVMIRPPSEESGYMDFVFLALENVSYRWYQPTTVDGVERLPVLRVYNPRKKCKHPIDVDCDCAGIGTKGKAINLDPEVEDEWPEF